MGFCGLLKPQQGFTTVVTMRVASREQAGLGNPNAICVSAQPDLGNRNDHCVEKLKDGSREIKLRSGALSTWAQTDRFPATRR